MHGKDCICSPVKQKIIQKTKNMAFIGKLVSFDVFFTTMNCNHISVGCRAYSWTELTKKKFKIDFFLFQNSASISPLK